MFLMPMLFPVRNRVFCGLQMICFITFLKCYLSIVYMLDLFTLTGLPTQDLVHVYAFYHMYVCKYVLMYSKYTKP